MHGSSLNNHDIQSSNVYASNVDDAVFPDKYIEDGTLRAPRYRLNRRFLLGIGDSHGQRYSGTDHYSVTRAVPRREH